MERQQFYKLPRFAPILSVIDAIFSEINVGLLVYHVERPDDIRTARLIYANREASRVTETDLGRRIGLLILEAFPALDGTSVLEQFADVVREQRSRRVGVVEYGDAHVRHGRYVTRAFPMPDDCFGVVFDEESSAAGTAGG
jgi:hypothetical protein